MPEVRNSSTRAYEAVRQRIIDGSLPAGAPLRQDAIAEALGVSKIPLREAMSRLEQDGLLTSYPNRGFVVRDLAREEADEVFELRLKLEPDAAARASLRVGTAEHQAARFAFEATARPLTPGGPDYALLNRRFHNALVLPGVGLLTGQLVDRLHVLAERYVRVHIQPVGRDQQATADHREILDAWLARDAGRVASLIATHIENTRQELRQQLAIPGVVQLAEPR